MCPQIEQARVGDTDSQTINIEWKGPFSFLRGTGLPCVFDDCEPANLQGVYLWTIRFGQEDRVNYVGKTHGVKRHFSRRLTEEHQYCFHGKQDGLRFRSDPLIDVSAFLNEGRRAVIIAKPTREQLATSRTDIERLFQSYRIFLGPLDHDDIIVKRVEGSIDRHLRSSCQKCHDFMSPSRVVGPGFRPLTIRSSFPSGIIVCGMANEFGE